LRDYEQASELQLELLATWSCVVAKANEYSPKDDRSVTSQAEMAAAMEEGSELLDEWPKIFRLEEESQKHLSFPEDFAPCKKDSGSAEESGGDQTAIKWIDDAQTYCKTYKHTRGRRIDKN
jgi:hypothetical protein